jgi:hypothetical protein
MSVVCCQIEVSASGRLLVQGSPTECGMCNREASIMRRSWLTRGCCARGGGVIKHVSYEMDKLARVNECKGKVVCEK